MVTYSNSYLGTSLKGFCRCNWSSKLVDLKVWRLPSWDWSYQVSPLVGRSTQRSQRFKAWGDLTHCCLIDDEGGLVLRNAGSLKERKRSPFLTAGKDTRTSVHIWPMIWMSLEADYFLGPLDKSPAQGTPWFQPCETLIREPSWARPDSWNRSVREFICVILSHCIYGDLLCSERKLMQ